MSWNNGFPIVSIGALVAWFLSGGCTPTQEVPSHAIYATSEGTPSAMLRETYGNLPLHFEENLGQTAAQVRFLSRGPNFTAFLTPSETVLTLRPPAKGNTKRSEVLIQPSASSPPNVRPQMLSAPPRPSDPAPQTRHAAPVVRMQLVGTNPAPHIAGAAPLLGKANYCVGHDQARWQTAVPTYGKVKYTAIYLGIDLVYYGKQHQLEYDFVVAPGADPTSIRLVFTDQAGQPLPH
jgi:hypothetical protein